MVISNQFTDCQPVSWSLNIYLHSIILFTKNKGVFQEDPLLFNTVMITYIDTIKEHLTSCYGFSNYSQSLGVFHYACLVLDNPASGQKC